MCYLSTSFKSSNKKFKEKSCGKLFQKECCFTSVIIKNFSFHNLIRFFICLGFQFFREPVHFLYSQFNRQIPKWLRCQLNREPIILVILEHLIELFFDLCLKYLFVDFFLCACKNSWFFNILLFYFIIYHFVIPPSISNFTKINGFALSFKIGREFLKY